MCVHVYAHMCCILLYYSLQYCHYCIVLMYMHYERGLLGYRLVCKGIDHGVGNIKVNTCVVCE